jgi:cytochrome c peroxidase
VKDGVQCENCHGAGSGYKTMAIMKDHAKAVAAGMTDFKDDAAKEKLCVTCHNDKSPTHKEFKFKEMWDKIKHPRPKKS